MPAPARRLVEWLSIEALENRLPGYSMGSLHQWTRRGSRRRE